MSSSPILRAIALLRLNDALARFSPAGAPHLIAATSDLGALCRRYVLWLAGRPTSLVRRVLKLFRDWMYGRRKALLIGIQKDVELKEGAGEPAPEEKDGALDGLHPDRARAVRKKKRSKKIKGVAAAASKPSQPGAHALRGPHHDVEVMRALLIDKYGYYPDDIVCIIDDDDPTHLQPTRDNIMSQMRYLVKDARDGDKFFFHYSGHAGQEDTDDIEEEDGKNEYIVTCDGYQIMDDVLHKELVGPLRNVKCTLTAVFDCCHSGSILDLLHSHCNDVYVPWLNKGNRRTKTFWANNRRGVEMFMTPESPFIAFTTEPDMNAEPLPKFSIPEHKGSRRSTGLSIDTAKSYPTPPPSLVSRHPSFNIPDIDIQVVDSSPPPEQAEFVSPVDFMMSPAVTFKYCDGWCREDPLLLLANDAAQVEANIICLSASKDSEQAWEDSQGRSMTQYLACNLSVDPHPTLHHLLTAVSYDIHSYYVTDLHSHARSYKKEARASGTRDTDPMAGTLEMHNFQNPQLSSFLPLNMEQLFNP